MAADLDTSVSDWLDWRNGVTSWILRFLPSLEDKELAELLDLLSALPEVFISGENEDERF